MSIKALEIKTSRVFNVVFTNNTVPTETPTNEANAELKHILWQQKQKQKNAQSYSKPYKILSFPFIKSLSFIYFKRSFLASFICLVFYYICFESTYVLFCRSFDSH